MKKFIFILFLVSTLILGGCVNKDVGMDATPSIPNPPIVEDILPDDFEQDEEEQKKKKGYIVSTVNGLRVRSKPNSSSGVVGNLDKNDCVLYLGEEGSYYKTIYKETPAYIHSSYCKIIEVDFSTDSVEKAIDFGCKLLGYPYVWGSERYHWGNGKLNTNFVNGEFDCSAFVQYVYYKTNGVILDVTSRAQVNNGVEIKKSQLKRGDLMFFTNASRKNKTGNERIGHVGIYFGDNYILHTASDHAVIEPISSVRWSYYITARRVV